MLFREYAATLPIDLAFQEFERELAELPGCYAAPAGCILLARMGGEPAGCVALRPLNFGGSVPWADARSAEPRASCEMKRLFVRVTARGHGLGRRLAERIIDEAQRIGYRRMLLDTLPSMDAANRLYESLGFYEVDAYYYNPNHARFMEKRLAQP